MEMRKIALTLSLTMLASLGVLSGHLAFAAGPANDLPNFDFGDNGEESDPTPEPTKAKPTPVASLAKSSPSASATPDEMAKLSKQGILASTVGGQYGTARQGTWADVDTAGESKAPISASISRQGGSGWKLAVYNNGENAYSFSVRVVQLTQGGSKAKTDSFTFSLKPGERAERQMSSGSGAVGAQVVLESYKRLKARPGASPKSSSSKAGRAGGSARTSSSPSGSRR